MTIYTIEYLTKGLKNARIKQRMSQRTLSERSGIPQAQISRIENAMVDLKTATLIHLARALNFEVMLVPRKRISLIENLIASSEKRSHHETTQRPMYALDDENDDEEIEGEGEGEGDDIEKS